MFTLIKTYISIQDGNSFIYLPAIPKNYLYLKTSGILLVEILFHHHLKTFNMKDFLSLTLAVLVSLLKVSV